MYLFNNDQLTLTLIARIYEDEVAVWYDMWFIVQIIIIMSVLFIGQRSPYYSPPLHQHHLINRNERKLRQEQYRLDLLDQMREKRERRERERQAEAQY